MLRRLLLGADDRLQGAVDRGRPGGVLPGPGRSALRDGAGDLPPALQHQHRPDLDPRAALPPDRAQRRDQHRAGQPALDGRARAGPARGLLGRPPARALPDGAGGGQRLRLARQRRRSAGPLRLRPAGGAGDGDRRGLGGAGRPRPRPPRLLRVPRAADGAVGRPGGAGLLRWGDRRRGARPQRPAPRALPPDRRRSAGRCLRGGRPRTGRHGDRARARIGPARPRPDDRGRSDRRPPPPPRRHHRRAGRAPPLPRVACRAPQHVAGCGVRSAECGIRRAPFRHRRIGFLARFRTPHSAPRTPG